jgi:hypothetical protein
VAFGLNSKLGYDRTDKKAADDRDEDYPQTSKGRKDFFGPAIEKDLDIFNEPDKKNSSEAGGNSYNNCHNEQNKPLPRGKVVKQFSQETSDHKKTVMRGAELRVAFK